MAKTYDLWKFFRLVINHLNGIDDPTPGHLLSDDACYGYDNGAACGKAELRDEIRGLIEESEQDEQFPEGLHPSIAGILKYFAYAHLPEHLQLVSRPFWDTANKLVRMDLEGPELTVALRKLLESKDCAVRAALK